jgi:two-component system sensor histidine kinase/response regulator
MKDLSECTILIVDDAETNIDILVDTLGEEYDIAVALDGESALDTVESEPPDLILLDIMMPGMNGYEVCRRLKNSEATCDIPVIFVTALGEEEDEIKGFELGAVDYITKPISPPRVIARVRTHLMVRETQRRLEAQNAQLIEASKLREDVDGIMRHDLKTPLNSIIGLPPLILDDAELKPEHVQSLKAIKASGYLMLNMINLTLDLMKMERGVYPYLPVPVDIVDLVRKISDEVRLAAEVRHNRLQIKVNGISADSASIFFILGEELLCYSMLANLIKNAVEASPEGETVSIEMDEANGPDGIRGRISVYNSGAVPEAIRDRFFEKYVTMGKSGGTGLGTYSARLIAETQQGEISLDSSDETGTVISVCLPITEPSLADVNRGDEDVKPVKPSITVDLLPALSILLVDDDPFNLQLLKTYLKDPRFCIDTAGNGKIALEKIKTVSYDITFMDMEMPVLNGVETIRQVRTFESLENGMQRCITAVALSAHDDPAIREKCLSAGFDGYLKKPAVKTDILRMLNHFFSPNAKSGENLREIPASSLSASHENQGRQPDAMHYSVEVDADLEDLIPDFLEKKRVELVELCNFLEKNDFEWLRQLGHKLKGTFNMYGFTFLSDACLVIENAAVKNDAFTITDQLDAMTDFMNHLAIRYVEDL